MSDGGDEEPSGGRGLKGQAPADWPSNNTSPICFSRRELSEILSVYGRKVAEGEWRDYAIDQDRNRAVFSIFRRSSEVPLYRIVKNPELARRQGAYAVLAAGGMILKRGHDLRQVLFALDRGLRLVKV